MSPTAAHILSHNVSFSNADDETYSTKTLPAPTNPFLNLHLESLEPDILATSSLWSLQSLIILRIFSFFWCLGIFVWLCLSTLWTRVVTDISTWAYLFATIYFAHALARSLLLRRSQRIASSLGPSATIGRFNHVLLYVLGTSSTLSLPIFWFIADMIIQPTTFSSLLYANVFGFGPALVLLEVIGNRMPIYASHYVLLPFFSGIYICLMHGSYALFYTMDSEYYLYILMNGWQTLLLHILIVWSPLFVIAMQSCIQKAKLALCARS